ncbi:MAG: patatin-like phospholipase family protein, partial [Sphingomonadales bacterium]
MKEKISEITSAKQKLKIPAENKLILCLDGGGMRGILSIQLLKTLEKIAGIPAYAMFDLVAGTSTGAIIAALMATGHTGEQIEQRY